MTATGDEGHRRKDPAGPAGSQEPAGAWVPPEAAWPRAQVPAPDQGPAQGREAVLPSSMVGGGDDGAPDLWAPPGWIYIVDGGPGDPGLVTVRASRILQAAEVVVADPGLEAVVEAWRSPTAALWVVPAAAAAASGSVPLPSRLQAAGRLPPQHLPQRLARWARAGLRVVRLVRGGLPGGEMEALVAAGVGLIPVPWPGRLPAPGGGPAPGEAPAPGGPGGLAAAGAQAARGAAGSEAADAVAGAGSGEVPSGTGAPAAVAGWVAPPLAGWRVAVTRAPEQAAGLAELLRQLGATVVEVPLIGVEPAAGERELDRELESACGSWWVLTSRNGAAALARRLDALGRDARALAGARVAVVGEATRRFVREALGLRPDLMPAEFTGARLWDELARRITPGQRVVWPRGDRAGLAAARPVEAAGGDLRAPVVYRTVLRHDQAAVLIELLANRQVDVVTLASPSAAEALAEAAGPGGPGRFFRGDGQGDGAGRPRVVCIGPRTAQRAAALGLPVDGVPLRYTAAGLVAALLEMKTAGGKA
ncbi:uroporphyrinogen III synthase [Thermaerobacter sp. PB12/4term]|nr:uroporphyrinogen III synthase [Thermaerobacter sp. PB12/4term]